MSEQLRNCPVEDKAKNRTHQHHCQNWRHGVGTGHTHLKRCHDDQRRAVCSTERDRHRRVKIREVGVERNRKHDSSGEQLDPSHQDRQAPEKNLIVVPTDVVYLIETQAHPPPPFFFLCSANTRHRKVEGCKWSRTESYDTNQTAGVTISACSLW